MTTTETITWQTEGLPDSEETVLIQTVKGMVGEGFHDGEAWRWANASLLRCPVHAFSAMPDGPPLSPPASSRET